MLDGVSDREKQVRKKVKTQKDQVAEENGKKKKRHKIQVERNHILIYILFLSTTESH